MIPPEVPVLLGREEAADLARAELADPIYARSQPPLLQRALEWVFERIAEGIDTVVNSAPGGWLGLLGLVVLVVLVIVAIRWRVTTMTRRDAATDPLFAGGPVPAAEHRARAQRLVAAGDWAGALRERLRALARDLEERGVLDVRPGRTADELARDAARALPGEAEPLRRAVRVFDDTWYGGRPAGQAEYAVVADADDRVARARPVSAPATVVPTGAGR